MCKFNVLNLLPQFMVKISNYMKRKIGLLVVIGLWISLVPESHAQQAQSVPLLIFEQDTVYKAEFERVYQKNNGGYDSAQTHSDSQYQEYLDLYINFKRKIFEAEAQGLHETEAFKNEFATYRKELVAPYLSAKDVEEKLIREAYDRSAYLVNAGHILLRLDPDAHAEDTLRIYKRLMSIRDSIVNGDKTFEEMAKLHSEDPSAEKNEGNLGYFSAFDMVYPFETAAFDTEEGEISLPVRTRFGYHLVKVNDKLPNEGKQRSAHIIIRVGDRYSAKDSAQAEDIINEIYTKLKEGADFAELAAQYSDDPSTAEKGGDLGTSRLLPEMERQKLSLTEGEFSEPFKTPYGWHILKVSEIEKRPEFEVAKASLQQRISRDSRAQLGRDALLNRIKKENSYEENAANFSTFQETVDASFARGIWKPDSTQLGRYDKTLFTIKGAEPVAIQEMVDYYLENRLRYPNLSAERAAEVVKDNFVRQWLLDYEEKQLPQKNPEFGYLLKEYRDGILLFNLMEKKVWKKAVEDTTGLRNYYETHKEEFYADESVDITEYRCTEDSVIQRVKDMLEKGKSEKEIDSVLNQRSSLNVRIITINYEKDKQQLDQDLFENEVGFVSDIVEENNAYVIRVIKEKFPPGIKPYEKAKSESITKYQDYLEEQWLEELAEKYPVEINEMAFQKLFQ